MKKDDPASKPLGLGNAEMYAKVVDRLLDQPPLQDSLLLADCSLSGLPKFDLSRALAPNG